MRSIAPLLLLASSDVGPSGVAASSSFAPGEVPLYDFCGACRWKAMKMTCDSRVAYMVDTYKMSELAAQRSILDEFDCIDNTIKAELMSEQKAGITVHKDHSDVIEKGGEVIKGAEYVGGKHKASAGATNAHQNVEHEENANEFHGETGGGDVLDAVAEGPNANDKADSGGQNVGEREFDGQQDANDASESESNNETDGDAGTKMPHDTPDSNEIDGDDSSRQNVDEQRDADAGESQSNNEPDAEATETPHTAKGSNENDEEVNDDSQNIDEEHNENEVGAPQPDHEMDAGAKEAPHVAADSNRSDGDDSGDQQNIDEGQHENASNAQAGEDEGTPTVQFCGHCLWRHSNLSCEQKAKLLAKENPNMRLEEAEDLILSDCSNDELSLTNARRNDRGKSNTGGIAVGIVVPLIASLIALIVVQENARRKGGGRGGDGVNKKDDDLEIMPMIGEDEPARYRDIV